MAQHAAVSPYDAPPIPDLGRNAARGTHRPMLVHGGIDDDAPTMDPSEGPPPVRRHVRRVEDRRPDADALADRAAGPAIVVAPKVDADRDDWLMIAIGACVVAGLVGVLGFAYGTVV